MIQIALDLPILETLDEIGSCVSTDKIGATQSEPIHRGNNIGELNNLNPRWKIKGLTKNYVSFRIENTKKLYPASDKIAFLETTIIALANAIRVLTDVSDLLWVGFVKYS